MGNAARGRWERDGDTSAHHARDRSVRSGEGCTYHLGSRFVESRAELERFSQADASRARQLESRSSAGQACGVVRRLSVACLATHKGNNSARGRARRMPSPKPSG
ncbi:hypothetical protein RRG08_028351 [Elysia crispata]|uniref:Uncharacterized protein n=1 Tax=Elysia crispata TaxID=231223 RepID=A0AAE1E5W3_9GAST|nr:hypothetical protein RRG08_028351 [Elysia crispata]